MKVFLGGTCNESAWREDLIASLEIDYFNPVVQDWTEECMAEELKQREECDFCLYYITPKMTGVYSIAEVVDDSNKRPEKTIFSFTWKDGEKEFTRGQLKSLTAVKDLVQSNGATVFDSLWEVSAVLNSYGRKEVERNKARRRTNAFMGL